LFPRPSLSSPLCFLFVARSRKNERERTRVLRKGAALRLPAAEVALFYKLYHAVLLYTNQQFGLARQVTTIAQLRAMPEEAQYELRSAFYAHRQLLEAFVQENPQHFSAEELALVASWQHGVHGQFYVLRHLQRYTVFLDVNDPPKAYGVLALHDDFADLFPQVPRLIDTMLLPFHHQITYDGQCRYYNLVFGRGITRRLNDVSDHRGSNSQAIDFESVKTYPIFTAKNENHGKSNT
jgi:hypothetical protein